MDYGSAGGDSDGPLYLNNSAAALISFTFEDDRGRQITGYSTMAEITASIGYRPCYVNTYPC
jgi:hypothetical protein